MKKLFDTVIAPFWSAPQSQIYTTLYRMSENKLVTSEIIQQVSKPNRKLYHITEKGQCALRDWLSETQAGAGSNNPFLLQIWLAGLIEDEIVLEVLSERIRLLRQRLGELESKPKGALDSEKDEPRRRFFWWATLNYGIQQLRFEIQWIEEFTERVRSGDYVDGKEGALRGLLEDAS